ncbi:hypothetical protein Esti_004074 [Eimeria stiedai]
MAAFFAVPAAPAIGARPPAVGLHQRLTERRQIEQAYVGHPRSNASLRTHDASMQPEHEEHQADCPDSLQIQEGVFTKISWLPPAVHWPPLTPSQNAPGFWQADGTFNCDWGALKSGEAFCSSVKGACAYCLSRALGGPSKLTAALLERLRSSAKAAIEDEMAHLISSVKNCASASKSTESNRQPEAAAEATQQLMKHPALQAVAFLSVHERRLAVFEIWLDRWQVLSGSFRCTCGSAEAADEGLMKVASENACSETNAAGRDAGTKAALEALRIQVAQLREKARAARQEEEFAVLEARNLTMSLVEKQQQLLLATERVKALEQVRADPAVVLMQRAQQQASSPQDDSAASQPFRFIAEKCEKLANLGRLMQQQQVAQRLKDTLLRLSWEAVQAGGNAGEAAAAGMTAVPLLGDLQELQTPHASLHSPRSQRARISSFCTSRFVQAGHAAAATAEQPASSAAAATAEDAGCGGELKDSQREQRSCVFANSGHVGSPPLRSLCHKAGSELVAQPLRPADVMPSPARSVGHAMRVGAETCTSKQSGAVDDLQAISTRRYAPSLRAVNTELDMDREGGEPLEGIQSRENPAHDAIWVDSFLGRMPEIL